MHQALNRKVEDAADIGDYLAMQEKKSLLRFLTCGSRR